MNHHKNNDIDIQSPCVGNCCLNECDVCLGCFRNIDEIKVWRASSVIEKQKILSQCQQRKAEKLER